MLHLFIHQRLLVYFANLQESLYFFLVKAAERKKYRCELGVTGTVGRQKMSILYVGKEHSFCVFFFTGQIKTRILKNRIEYPGQKMTVFVFTTHNTCSICDHTMNACIKGTGIRVSNLPSKGAEDFDVLLKGTSAVL